ncbi:MFS transporter [Vibrio viridaestus]|uniref:MFS transporter n=1 Tax=Vibrio viridaestus TaxID=2487322 RepID=A0A3N9TBA7_9VIBR|nr:MFS transporter [Vibrio viridaestus]RQW61043.1 MFS transporter [Vibrio viridaestus]
MQAVQQRNRRISYGLALGSFIVFCNLYLFQPILPYLADHFSMSSTKTNWIFAASTLTLSIALIPWAIASECVGRKKVLLAGLISLPIVGLSMLISHSWFALVIGRCVTGLGIAAFTAVAVAYMAEELPKEAFSKAIGLYIAANSLGGISGRLMGGLLTNFFNWHYAVVVMAIISLIGTYITYKALPKKEQFTPSHQPISVHMYSMIGHFRNKIVWIAMLIGGVNFALFVNLYSVMGFRLSAEPYSLPVGLTSLIFICYLGGTLSSSLSGKWKKNHSAISGMLIGSVISMTGMFIALYESIPTMLFGLALISFGAFFTHTLAYGWVSQRATTAKATATALYLVHYYIGGSLGGFFLLHCWQIGQWFSVVVGGSVLYVTLFLLIWRLHNHQSKHIDVAIQAQSHT